MDYDFSASTGYWITLTSHHYQQEIDARLRPFGITFRQFQVIAWLKYEGPLTHRELAKRMFIEPPTLVGILSRMETMQWTARTECELDRRKKYIDVGPAAEPVWENIVKVLNQVREESVAGLSTEEVEQLHYLLSRVMRNLDESALPPAPKQSFLKNE